MTPDQILDRNRLKKQLSNWKIVAIFALFLCALALINTGKKTPHASLLEPSHIARIHVEDTIFFDPFALEVLKEIEENKSIKAVIIHVNSPGGTFVGGESMYNAILKISSQKPTVTVMDDMATSAGYMVATASEFIIAYSGTITGSIGVISPSYEITELADKVGVKFHNFKSSPLKGGPIPNEPLSLEMKHSMDVLVKDLYEAFFNIVASRRNIPQEKLRAIADGRAYTGRQALQLGLIDAIGDQDTALKWLKNNKKLDTSMQIVDYALVRPQEKLFGVVDLEASFKSAFRVLLSEIQQKFYI